MQMSFFRGALRAPRSLHFDMYLPYISLQKTMDCRGAPGEFGVEYLEFFRGTLRAPRSRHTHVDFLTFPFKTPLIPPDARRVPFIPR